MSGEPSVRAKHLQLWLRLVDELDAERARRFYAAMRPESVAAIRDAQAIAWLPIELDVEMADALATSQGAARAHEFYAAMYRSAAESSLLAQLARTAEKLLGSSPTTFVKWMPRGWAGLFRDAGTVQTELVGESAARIVYDGIPPVCARSSAWVESLASGVEPTLTWNGVDGLVHLDTSGLGERRVVITLEWHAKK